MGACRAIAGGRYLRVIDLGVAAVLMLWVVASPAFGSPASSLHLAYRVDNVSAPSAIPANRNADAPLELPGGDITFYLRVARFLASQGVAYRYRLLGLEEDWSNADASQAQVVYNDLPPGQYRFQVAGLARGDGPQGDSFEVALSVPPPFWRRPYFLTGVLALLLGLACMMSVRRRRSLQTGAAPLRADVDAKGNIATRTERLCRHAPEARAIPAHTGPNPDAAGTLHCGIPEPARHVHAPGHSAAMPCAPDAEPEPDTPSLQRPFELEYVQRLESVVFALLRAGTCQLDTVAGELGHSPRTLQRKIQALCGCGFRDYVVDLQLRRVKASLDAGGSIKQAALEAGFSSQSYMSRVFKRRFGRTASEYRSGSASNTGGPC